MDVLSHEYAERMVWNERRGWRGPSPSAWDLRRLKPGYMLDVGCGIGRQLRFAGGNGVGVDPNPACVKQARAQGLTVVTPEDFDYAPASFDSMLIAHVFEHISRDEGISLIKQYLPFVKPGGQLILITPQERGYTSDPTHIRFVDLEELKSMAEALSLEINRSYSFPLPRPFGRFYIGNEFRITARV